jgi:hypothetical protein
LAFFLFSEAFFFWVPVLPFGVVVAVAVDSFAWN